GPGGAGGRGVPAPGRLGRGRRRALVRRPGGQPRRGGGAVRGPRAVRVPARGPGRGTYGTLPTDHVSGAAAERGAGRALPAARAAPPGGAAPERPPAHVPRGRP